MAKFMDASAAEAEELRQWSLAILMFLRPKLPASVIAMIRQGINAAADAGNLPGLRVRAATLESMVADHSDKAGVNALLMARFGRRLHDPAERVDQQHSGARLPRDRTPRHTLDG